MPCISVVMSVYNTKEAYLRTAVESILNQTFRDFEFLIVLDCPTDNSELILNEYALKDERIKLIKNETNLGLTKSLNAALKVAAGKYIARMDADDYSVPWRFEKEYEFLEKNTDVGVVGSYGFVGNKSFRCFPLLNENSEITRIRFMFFNNGIPHPSAMFRRILNDGTVVEYDETIKKSQDYALWSRLITKTKISFIPDFLIVYRLHEGQISSTPAGQFLYSKMTVERQLDTYFDFIGKEKYKEYLLNFMYSENRPLPSDIKSAFDYLIECNNKTKVFTPKLFKRVLKELTVEYMFSNRNMLSKWGVKSFIKCLSFVTPVSLTDFVKMFVVPRMKYDKGTKKFAAQHGDLLKNMQ